MNFKLPGNKKIVLACVVVFLVGIFLVVFLQFYKIHFESGSVEISKIIARVEGNPLSELDLENYNRAQKLTIQDNSLKPGLTGLKRITVMEIELVKQNAFPTQEELETQLVEQVKKHGGKKTDDLKRAVEIYLVKDRLLDKITFWREAEFLALRLDVLPMSKIPASTTLYQEKSRGVLEQVRKRFNAGEDVSKLAQIVRDNEVVKRDFVPNAVQYLKLSENGFERKTQRFVKQTTPSVKDSAIDQSKPGDVVENVRKPFAQELHVLEMKTPKSNDLWCDVDACVLIRVLNGANGNYTSLDDWLKEKGF